MLQKKRLPVRLFCLYHLITHTTTFLLSINPHHTFSPLTSYFSSLHITPNKISSHSRLTNINILNLSFCYRILYRNRPTNVPNRPVNFLLISHHFKVIYAHIDPNHVKTAPKLIKLRRGLIYQYID